VLELGVRAFLDYDYPAELAKRPDDFMAGDPGQWRHEANRKRCL